VLHDLGFGESQGFAPQNEREILMNLGKFNGSLWGKGKIYCTGTPEAGTEQSGLE